MGGTLPGVAGHLGHGYRPPGQPPCCPGRPLPDQPPPDQPPPGQPLPGQPPPGQPLPGQPPPDRPPPDEPRLSQSLSQFPSQPRWLLRPDLSWWSARSLSRPAAPRPGWPDPSRLRCGRTASVNVHRTGVLRVPRAVKAITVVQEARGSGTDARSAVAGRPAGGPASGSAAPGAGADAAGEWPGPGGVAARWAAVGAVAAGALADSFPLACTDAGSAAAQGTRPHSFGGPGELSCRARARPPPATAAMVAVMPAAATQRCRARRSVSRGGPAVGWPGPLAKAAHRLVPGMRMRNRPTRDMAVSPVLVRSPNEPKPPGPI
jgi:hypothetical protein